MFRKNSGMYFANSYFLTVAKEARIEPKAFFNSGRNVSIGDYSSIGEGTKIRGSVQIGNSCNDGRKRVLSLFPGNMIFHVLIFPMTQQGFQE